MTTPASRWKIVLVQTLVAIAVVVAMCAAASGYVGWKLSHWAPPPDGRHLREVFAAKRPLFEQLVRMTAEDSNGTVATGNNALPSERLSQARVLEYRRVASAIDPGLNFSMACGRAPTFTFEESTLLLAIGPHFANGIDYIPPEDEKYVHIVKSIDEAKASHLTEYWVPVADRWYLFHYED